MARYTKSDALVGKVGGAIIPLIPLQYSEKRHSSISRGADKSLARPRRKQATATEDFDVHISYLLSQLEEY
jgi:hypothetical protein